MFLSFLYQGSISNFTTPFTTPFTAPLLHHFPIKLCEILRVFIKLTNRQNPYKIKGISDFPKVYKVSPDTHNKFINYTINMRDFPFKINTFQLNYTITTPHLHHHFMMFLP